ncbi:metallophosphoesterase [Vulcanococcus limneticus]|uniref:metallophosphoesterase n=1 Tax=Vulcanococcus limneticus TaxID=2170428 RepID=UPI000B99AB5A|nr:metallophosphoesterase [Vulcanococcus limneticus]MCP9790219.1 metallophosphoesterase [Vulcanococcus limneticus MW73D5]MCP9894695.1 metallophosphoesterase [Vulcanococcus limneticus Candia 3F8]MCP9895618.1 metallophosphoesterase [Vulcanococcus limneticus Candia 3B3]
MVQPLTRRVLQLSDPHLLADPCGHCRGRESLAWLAHGLEHALSQVAPVDLLLLTGDLCQDESWGGYARLRELLESLDLPVALLGGNHDDTVLLRAALGRRAAIAPTALALGAWRLLLLSSHRPGDVAGWIEAPQLAWLDRELAAGTGPVLVALHHPPLPIGSAELDGIGLQRPEALLERLLASQRVRGVVFGHVHQHWAGSVARAGCGAPLTLWACPSTLAPFAAAQSCPLGRPDWPGGRLLELRDDGRLETTLLRWPPLAE